LCIDDLIGMASVGIADVRAKRGDFHLVAIAWNQHNAKLSADGDAFRKEFHYSIGRGIGSYVVVRRFAAKKDVAHTSTYQQRLVPMLLQRFTDRIGQFPRSHGVIMRQPMPSPYVRLPETA
jgi:hypothetical protein